MKIDPCMAFGTGTHPTTQLCMEMLEDAVAPGQAVIDVGCGSGILSIGALKLGAGPRPGGGYRQRRDHLHPRERGRQRRAGAPGDRAGLGERDPGGQVQPARRRPLVLANILAPVIIRLFDAGLAELVAPGGTLVLSGILDDQAGGVIEAAQASGLRFVEQRKITDWVVILLRK